MISCGCKNACACIRNCQCKNAGLKWINMCSGCGGRTCNNSDLNDDVVWAQPFPVLHARNVSALFGFNSFPEPHIHIQSFTPLAWGGVHTLKHYCVYMLKCYDRDSHRIAGAWSVGIGYGIQSNWYGQLKHVHFISMPLITIRLIKWLSMIPWHGHMVFLTKLTD